MARAYRMTSARRAAIKKAQRISAQKRRGKKKKRAIGAGIAAAGVIGVTMYAANGYRKRNRSSKSVGNINVVSVTTSADKPYTGNKELDIVRRDITSSLLVERDPDTKKINYGLNYRAIGTDIRDNKPVKQWTRERKIGVHRRGRGVVRVTPAGVAVKLKRNRPKFNDDRRMNYSPGERHQKYLRESEGLRKRRTVKKQKRSAKSKKRK